MVTMDKKRFIVNAAIVPSFCMAAHRRREFDGRSTDNSRLHVIRGRCSDVLLMMRRSAFASSAHQQHHRPHQLKVSRSNTMASSLDKAFDKHVKWLESIRRETVTLDVLKEYYTHDVHFRDPFNDVCGIDNVQRVYDKMFDQVNNIHFQITEYALNGASIAFLSWTMTFEARGKEHEIVGASRLRFEDNGLVSEHFDFWDTLPAFETIPVIGFVLKAIKRHMV